MDSLLLICLWALGTLGTGQQDAVSPRLSVGSCRCRSSAGPAAPGPCTGSSLSPASAPDSPCLGRSHVLSLKTPASSIVAYRSRARPLNSLSFCSPVCLFFRVTLSRVFPTFMAAPLMAPSFETPFCSFACPWPETAPAPSAAGVSAAVAGLGRLLFYRLQYLPYNICAAL